jgi:hypothetical protein
MSTRPDFALNPMAALVFAYNTVASALNALPSRESKISEVSKFSDKATAVKRLNSIIDAVEAAGFEVSYLPNGAIEKISQLDLQARSNAAIADAVASNPELAAMVMVEDGFVPPTEDPTLTNVQTDGAKTVAEPVKSETSVGGLSTLELTHRIEVLVENPKRKGSRARQVFDLYRTGQTGEEFVQAVIAAGFDRRVALANLHWDLDKGFVFLGEVSEGE